MWEVTRSLAAHATKIDPSEEGDHGSAGGGGSEESSSFKQQIEIPLAVSLVSPRFLSSFSLLRFFFVCTSTHEQIKVVAVLRYLLGRAVAAAATEPAG